MRSVFVALLLFACSEPPDALPARPLRVAAATSLTDVLPQLVRVLELGPVEPRFDASSTLARQIELEGGVDLFLSADMRWAEHVVQAGVTTGAAPVPFATNRLVVVVPSTSATAPATFAELARLEHVAVASAEVPAGRLARAAFEHEGVLAEVTPHLVDAPNVRGALAWVARGEADAAIVFATDARVEPTVRTAFEVPASDHPSAVDVGVVLRGDHEEEAARLLAALTTPHAREVLAAAGFGPPPP